MGEVGGVGAEGAGEVEGFAVEALEGEMGGGEGFLEGVAGDDDAQVGADGPQMGVEEGVGGGGERQTVVRRVGPVLGVGLDMGGLEEVEAGGGGEAVAGQGAGEAISRDDLAGEAGASAAAELGLVGGLVLADLGDVGIGGRRHVTRREQRHLFVRRKVIRDEHLPGGHPEVGLHQQPEQPLIQLHGIPYPALRMLIDSVAGQVLPGQIEVDLIAPPRGADGGVVPEPKLQLGVPPHLTALPRQALLDQVDDGEHEQGLVGSGALGLGPGDVQPAQPPKPFLRAYHKTSLITPWAG